MQAKEQFGRQNVRSDSFRAWGQATSVKIHDNVSDLTKSAVVRSSSKSTRVSWSLIISNTIVEIM